MFYHHTNVDHQNRVASKTVRASLSVFLEITLSYPFSKLFAEQTPTAPHKSSICTLTSVHNLLTFSASSLFQPTTQWQATQEIPPKHQSVDLQQGQQNLLSMSKHPTRSMRSSMRHHQQMPCRRGQDRIQQEAMNQHQLWEMRSKLSDWVTSSRCICIHA
jgi:hypothetical protein